MQVALMIVMRALSMSAESKHAVTIKFLKDRQDCIPVLADIWCDVLGKIWLPDVPKNRIVENLKLHLNIDSLPLTLVAFEGDIPVGMCSLRANDGIRPDLMPWLGSLVVSAEHQHKGIGSKLIQSTVDKARQMGFEKLYLFAFDKTIPEYYQQLGWVGLGWVGLLLEQIYLKSIL